MIQSVPVGSLSRQQGMRGASHISVKFAPQIDLEKSFPGVHISLYRLERAFSYDIDAHTLDLLIHLFR